MTAPAQPSVVVAGAGIFGATAALELRRRGWRVTLLEDVSPPAPRAASTDISKVVRREYGGDREYLRLASAAFDGWRRWNAEWPEPLYHESGLLALAGEALDAEGNAGGGFEASSFRSLREEGLSPQRLTPSEVTARFPAWRTTGYRDAFFHPAAGWAESGRVVAQVVALAVAAGVELLLGAAVVELLAGDDGIAGVRTADGREHRADHTLVAAGVWSGRLAGIEWGMWPTAHPVFHLRPARPELFVAERFPVFMADIANTGWYGFPLHPREGVVKVARHALGRRVEPDVARIVAPGDEDDLRAFLREALPELADAPVAASRCCLYCDTADGHFWIDRDPVRAGERAGVRGGLTVASGGSGHAFKFAPLLGGLIADAVEGVDNPALRRFRWRAEARAYRSEEEARASS